MAGYNTRNKSGNDVIGHSAELPQSDLPTLRDILAYGCLLKEQAELGKFEFKDRDLAKQVCGELKKVWTRVNHKIVSSGVISLDINIERKILTGWNMMISVKSKRVNAKKENQWRQTLDKAFNILICRCPFMSCTDFGCRGCPNSIHIFCSCPAKAKIPMMEVPFFHSQLNKVGSKGSMRIGTVDNVESAKQAKALIRADKKKSAKDKKQSKQEEAKREEAKKQVDFENNFTGEDVNETAGDEDFANAATARLVKQTRQNRLKLTNMARVSLSCDVSISATAQIGTALLIDLGIVTAENTSKIIDKSKIRRERDKVIKDLHMEGLKSLKEKLLKSILFDGKKSMTKTLLENEEGEQFPGVVEMDHYSIVDGIDGSYLTHLTPEDGKGKTIAEIIFEWILETGQEDNIVVIGGDSTGVNTGWERGAIHFMEASLGHKVMWTICFLHLNELGLRHLIEQLDGPTASGNTFTGKVCKLICDEVQDYVTNPDFKRIDVEEGILDLPDDVVEDLSHDQKHGYKLVSLITGRSQDLSCLKLKPGPVCHSRWLTTANRLMMLYCKKHGLRGKAIKVLTTLISFVVSIYYKMWFEIKCSPLMIDGPRHLLKTVQLLSVASPDVQEVVQPVVQRGAYHGHSENVLLSLLCSDSGEERSFAVDKILELRGEDKFGDKSVRDFHTPPINWNASSLQDMIDWSVLSEPILTCDLSTDEVRSLKEVPFSVDKFVCHTQSCERAVKETTNASAKVYGFERRDGYIRAKVKSRKLVSKPQSKKDLIGMLG